MAPAIVAAIELVRMSRFLTWPTSWPMTARSSRSSRMRMMPVVAATTACFGARRKLAGKPVAHHVHKAGEDQRHQRHARPAEDIAEPHQQPGQGSQQKRSLESVTHFAFLPGLKAAYGDLCPLSIIRAARTR